MHPHMRVSLLPLQDRDWCRLAHQRIGMPMHECPHSVFLPKDVRDAQRHRRRSEEPPTFFLTRRRAMNYGKRSRPC
jgi:hypothetical protein